MPGRDSSTYMHTKRGSGGLTYYAHSTRIITHNMYDQCGKESSTPPRSSNHLPTLHTNNIMLVRNMQLYTFSGGGDTIH